MPIARRKVRRPLRRAYRIHPWDHPKRWLCLKPDGNAYLVELDYFAPGRHACGCRWFECHDWDGPPIKPCIHIRRVMGTLARRVLAAGR